MKRINRKGRLILNGLLLVVVIAMVGCTVQKILIRPFTSEKILHISQLKNWADFRTLNNYVFYLDKGDTVPLALSMDTDFMEFKQDRIDVVAKQKLYFMIKIPENLSADELAALEKLDARSFCMMPANQRAAFLKNYMLYVSKDAEHWAPIYGSKAYRHVLGFKAGMVSFALMPSTAEGLGASLNIRTVK